MKTTYHGILGLNVCILVVRDKIPSCGPQVTFFIYGYSNDFAVLEQGWHSLVICATAEPGDIAQDEMFTHFLPFDINLHGVGYGILFISMNIQHHVMI